MIPDGASRIIVALDTPTAADALALVDRLDGRATWVKVGLELYLAAGAGIVQALRERGLQVFLDLKLHDIPNTVAGAIRSLGRSGASLLTVHALGGPAMLAAAQQALAQSAAHLELIPPRLLAVTVLTSMSPAELFSVGVEQPPIDAVSRLAALARAAGLAGMVCSPQEVARLRAELGPATLLVVPGIRPATSGSDDQTRIATPRQAFANGASMLVIGRPITASHDPAAAFDSILASLA